MVHCSYIPIKSIHVRILTTQCIMTSIAEFFAILSLFCLLLFLSHTQINSETILYSGIISTIIEGFILFLKIKHNNLTSKYTTLENEYAFILATFNKANFGLGVIDLNGTLIKMNRKLAQTLGHKSSKAFFRERQAPIKFDEFIKNKAHINHLIENKTKRYQTVMRSEKSNGEIIWLSAYISFVADKDGTLKYYVLQTQKMATRTKSEILLSKDDCYNQTTNLLNSHGLEESVKRYLSNADLHRF